VLKKVIAITAVCAAIFAASSLAVSGIDKRKKDDTLKYIDIFSGALATVQEEYVDDTSGKELVYGALAGMLSSLDPHSQFLDPDSYEELKVDTEGKFGGLGIEITIKDGMLTIITPIEDTPAWRAGLKAKDRIVKINDELTRDITITEAVKKMRGKPGEAVNLTILREAEKKVLEFKIVRDIIKVRDIKDARILQGGIGYIRLIEFRENTPQDLDAVLEKLNKEGMSALIIDLRNNPGGLLEVSAKSVERFVDNGKLIVSTKGRKPSQNMEFVSHGRKPAFRLPLAILINEGSASGSEIVAGCLQDYKRAVIVGEKSFGKGFVQTVIPLADGSALKLTTSRYFTPLGRQIQGEGIVPDIVVGNGLPRKETEEGPAPVPEDCKSDKQLIAAVDALKAVKVYYEKTAGI
jgi:carboxyl-terminal processing protease